MSPWSRKAQRSWTDAKTATIAKRPGRWKEASYAAAFQASPLGIVVTDPTQADNPIVSANPAFCTMTGYTMAEIVGKNCRFLQGPETDSVALSEIRNAIAYGKAIRRVILNYRKDGTTFWNALELTTMRGPDGALTGFVGISTDVSIQRKNIENATDLARRLQSVAETIPGFVYQRANKADGTVEFLSCSKSLNRLLELPDAPLSYQDLLDHIHPADLPMFNRLIAASVATIGPTNITFRIITDSGAVLWIRGFATPREDRAGRLVWDACCINITSERLAEERLTYLTHHDPLTGLENRPRFEHVVSNTFKTINRECQRLVLYSIDIGEIAEIRDTLSIAVANAFLQIFTHRLVAFAGPSARVARLSETQFAAVVIEEITAAQQSGAWLRAELAATAIVDGHELQVQPQIGIVSYPGDGKEAELSTPDLGRELIKRSEIALWEAKRSGRAETVVYSKEIDDRRSSRAILRQSLHQALPKRQFEVHYQPLIDLRSNLIVGAEALVRWLHPTLGMQRPDLFIPLAEESGAIVPLGEWILKQAMCRAKAWDNPEFGSPRIAINVSGVQLQRSDFAATVGRLLDETGVDPARIELELTEGFLIDTSSKIVDVLGKIREFGVGLAIDDFGTGYSSFEYLKRLPVDKIKIDQTFIRHLIIDTNGAAIVRAIIQMSNELGLETVCEGIETKTQMEFLLSQGCATGQGYYFAMPMTAEDFEWLLRSKARLGVTPKRQLHLQQSLP